jgi:hypothetical protein
MENITYGAMPGVVTPAGAPGACNTEAFDSNTLNHSHFATDGSQRKTNMLTHTFTSTPAPAPVKAAILAALTARYDSPNLFSYRMPPIRRDKRIHSIHETMCGDFLVYMETKTVYCKNLNAVMAFAQKLGMSK